MQPGCLRACHFSFFFFYWRTIPVHSRRAAIIVSQFHLRRHPRGHRGLLLQNPLPKYAPWQIEQIRSGARSPRWACGAGSERGSRWKTMRLAYKFSMPSKCHLSSGSTYAGGYQPIGPSAPSITRIPNPHPVEASSGRISIRMFPRIMSRCRYLVGGASEFSLEAHAVPSNP